MGVLLITSKRLGRPLPGATLGINWANPLSRGLTHAYLPTNHRTREPNLVTRAMTSPGTTEPGFIVDPRDGLAWDSSSIDANKNIITADPSWVRGRSEFTAMVHVRTTALPSGGISEAYAFEPVSDNAASSRFNMLLANGVLGATGFKWGVAFRTGLAASTLRNVNAGAGGTTVGVGDIAVLHFTFDSVADLYTLYLNGVQEAQLSVSETAIADTAPAATPRFIGNGATFAQGSLFRFNMWNRLLSLGEMWQTIDSRTRWDLYLQPHRVYAPIFSKARFDDSHQIIGGPM